MGNTQGNTQGNPPSSIFSGITGFFSSSGKGSQPANASQPVKNGANVSASGANVSASGVKPESNNLGATMNKKNVKKTMNASTNDAEPASSTQPATSAQPVGNGQPATSAQPVTSTATKIEGVSTRMNGGKRNRKTRRRQRSCRR